jgi:hypothetical protein
MNKISVYDDVFDKNDNSDCGSNNASEIISNSNNVANEEEELGGTFLFIYPDDDWMNSGFFLHFLSLI